MDKLTDFISAAKGELEVDLLLKGGRIVNTRTMEIYPADVAVYDDTIVGFGDYKAKKVVDVAGKIIVPGFIDAHVHVESSMVAPASFAQTVLPLGTTSVIADPHEISNVCGLDGARYVLQANSATPLNIYVMLPSCVPATPLETSGADLSAKDLMTLKYEPFVLGLAEMMNFPGVLFKVPAVLEKIVDFSDKMIDGHAPLLTGKDLSAYIGAGISSDHECTNLDEAREKLRQGMQIAVREGSVTRDLADLIPLIDQSNYPGFSLATDDREPVDLINEGHINFLLKKAVSLGIDPVVAITMATYNTAKHYGLKKMGLIAPGYYADIVVLSDLKDFYAEQVYKRGELVAENQKPLFTPSAIDDSKVKNTVNLSFDAEKLKIPAQGDKIRVIELVPGQILTKEIILEAKVEDGLAVSDPERDILKLVVIERHKATGNIGLGFVKGLGLKQGAISSTIAHDSHNLIICGTNDRDMARLVEHTVKMQGGLAVCNNNEILGDLPLPIGGLMSELPLSEVKEKLEKLFELAKNLGSSVHSPFMTMAFLALPVIPELKLTDRGLVNVNKFDFVSLFAKEEALIK